MAQSLVHQAIAAIQEQSGDGNGDGGGIAADDLDSLLEARAITVDSFTAQPPETTPCGSPPVLLSWQITKHPSAVSEDQHLLDALGSVHFELGVGSLPLYGEVPLTGARSVRPWSDTQYDLFAGLNSIGGRVRSSIANVSVGVTDAACSRGSIDEGIVRGLVQSYVDQTMGQINELSLRSAIGLEIDPSGVSLSAQFVYSSIVDVDVDMDARFSLSVQDCSLTVSYAAFGVDADLPWWLDLIAPGVKEIVEAIVSDQIEGRLKP